MLNTCPLVVTLAFTLLGSIPTLAETHILGDPVSGVWTLAGSPCRFDVMSIAGAGRDQDVTWIARAFEA